MATATLPATMSVVPTAVDGAAAGQAHHVRATADYRGSVAADAADNIRGALHGATEETQDIAGAGAAGHFCQGRRF